MRRKEARSREGLSFVVAMEVTDRGWGFGASRVRPVSAHKHTKGPPRRGGAGPPGQNCTPKVTWIGWLSPVIIDRVSDLARFRSKRSKRNPTPTDAPSVWSS